MHESKTCQRCKTIFECKAGSVTQCQCYEVQLSAEEHNYIEKNYTDCLCKNCLLELQKEFHLNKGKHISH
jgi:ribosomal protein L34E